MRAKIHDEKTMYAAYMGDEFIDLGDMDYITKKLNVTPETIKWYSSPAGRKRSEGKKDRIYVFIMED